VTDVPAVVAVIVIAIAGGAVGDAALGAVVREVTVVAIRAAVAVDAEEGR
jgi:hypothetical protein